jgi:hypothetical protein
MAFFLSTGLAKSAHTYRGSSISASLRGSIHGIYRQVEKKDERRAESKRTNFVSASVQGAVNSEPCPALDCSRLRIQPVLPFFALANPNKNSTSPRVASLSLATTLPHDHLRL